VSSRAGSRGGVRQEAASARLRGLRSALSEVWSQNMGKAGLLLLAFVVAASIYAAVTVPSDFVNVWTFNVKAWEDNPYVVPPRWVEALGSSVAPHIAEVLDEPKSASAGVVEVLGQRVVGYVERYTLTYNLREPAFPKDVLLRYLDVKPGTVVGRGGEVEPQIATYIVLTRPDGKEVLLNKPASRSLSELAQVGVERLDQAAVAEQLASMFNISLTEAQGKAMLLLFGTPSGEAVEPLTGRYKIDVYLVYTARGVNPKEIQRAVEGGRLGVGKVKVVVKGSAYGLIGTDDKGRDLYMGLLYGFPAALLVGLFAAVAFVAIGLITGVVSGYYGGIIDEVIQRTVDILANIPLLPILIIVGVIVQEMDISPWDRLFIIIGFLILFSWGGLAIIVRSMTLTIKSEPYIEAAKAIGASNARIIFRHIMPQILPYAMASLVFNVPSAILTEAGLSILGIRHGLPTWGSILADARAYIGAGGSYGIWWWILPPGLLIGLTSVAFVFLGLAIETIVDPRLRRT
jgi:ABC-type dipeptide/oligopeptide/nickel transport system permease subunit